MANYVKQYFNSLTRVDAQGKSILGAKIIAIGTYILTDTDEDVAIVGVLATDEVLVSVKSQSGTADTSGLVGICAEDKVNLTATAVGDGDGVITIVVIRP